MINISNRFQVNYQSESFRSILLLFPLLILIFFLTIQVTKVSIVLGVLIGLSPLLYRKILNFNTYLFLLILSLILEKYSYYIGFTIRLPMLFVVGTVLVLFLHHAIKGQLKIKYTQLYLLFAVLFLIYSLGAIWAINPVRVIRVCILYLFLFALFFIAYQLIDSETHIKKALNYFVAVGILGALYGLYQIIAFVFYLPGQLPFIDYLSHNEYYNIGLTVFKIGGNLVPRINSTFNDPVLIGSFTAMGLMILISRYCFLSTSKKLTIKIILGYIIAGLILFSSVILTFSRSAWLGMIFGFIILSILLLNNRTTRNFILRMNLMVLIIMTIILFIYPLILENLFTRITQSFDLSEKSTAGHLKWFQISLHAWSEYPLLGVGLNNFGEFYATNYQSTSYAMTHSAYFSFLAETGIIGFLLELIIIVTLVRYLYLALSKAKTLEDKNWYYILVGLASAYFVILGSNITYHFYTQFYVWFFMGLIVATSRYVLEHISIKKIKNN